MKLISYGFKVVQRSLFGLKYSAFSGNWSSFENLITHRALLVITLAAADAIRFIVSSVPCKLCRKHKPEAGNRLLRTKKEGFGITPRRMGCVDNAPKTNGASLSVQTESVGNLLCVDIYRECQNPKGWQETTLVNSLTSRPVTIETFASHATVIRI